MTFPGVEFEPELPSPDHFIVSGVEWRVSRFSGYRSKDGVLNEESIYLDILRIKGNGRAKGRIWTFGLRLRCGRCGGGLRCGRELGSRGPGRGGRRSGWLPFQNGK